MNALIEKVVSQTINKYINENCSERKTINENDGDDMGIYKELDDKVIHICYSHNFNVQTRVGDDRAYINYSKYTKKVQRKLNFYMYKWLFGVKQYIIAFYFALASFPPIYIIRSMLGLC